MAAATLLVKGAGLVDSEWAGWRLLGQKQWYHCWQCEGEHYTVVVSFSPAGGWAVKVNGQATPVSDIAIAESSVTLTQGDQNTTVSVYSNGASVTAITPALTLPLSQSDYAVAEADDHDLTAPMNGRVVTVMVTDGQAVEEGEPLVVLEAMKMEQTIRAPHSGIIDQILHQAGSLVEEGAALLTFCEESEDVMEPSL